MKRRLRTLVADGVAATGALHFLRRRQRRSLVVLCYHRVLPADLRAAFFVPDLAVTPSAFDEHVAFVARYYQCLPLREAMALLRAGGSQQRPLLSITFDDGYWDNHAHARPILNRHGVRATFFVVSSLIGTPSSTWYDALARALQRLGTTASASLASPAPLDDAPGRWIAEHVRHGQRLNVAAVVRAAKALSPPVRAAVLERVTAAAGQPAPRDATADRLMNADEVRALAADGHEIGSHTRTHPILTQLRGDALTDELSGSRDDLAALTGAPPESLAYPNGDFDDATLDATRGAGYRCAVTTLPGLNSSRTDSLTLRRVFISQDRLARANGRCATSLLELELTGVADRVFLRRQRLGISS
ncbi:MAG: polysaccharide deacetylase family protein [Deltaproteobacteria bacterium]|nr:polysaccharide deacetylase family protein [Deltaproteobacteria bacterium]